jgi:hypothetical protein
MAEKFTQYEFITPSILPPSQRIAAKQVTKDMNNPLGDANLIENYDYATMPPKRSLSLFESKYKLGSNLPIADYYPATLEYTNIMQEVTPKLNTINAVLQYLESISDTSLLPQVVEKLVGAGGMIPYTLRHEL